MEIDNGHIQVLDDVLNSKLELQEQVEELKLAKELIEQEHPLLDEFTSKGSSQNLHTAPYKYDLSGQVHPS